MYKYKNMELHHIYLDEKTQTWEAGLGYVGDVIKEAIALAQYTNQLIEIREFNGIPIRVHQHTTEEEAYRHWANEMDERRKESNRKRREQKLERAWHRVLNFGYENNIESVHLDSQGMRKIVEIVLDTPDF